MPRRYGRRAPLRLGVSMIPLAETTLMVKQTGRRRGAWAVFATSDGAVFVVCAVASVVGRLLPQPLLDDSPPALGDAGFGGQAI